MARNDNNSIGNPNEDSLNWDLEDRNSASANLGKNKSPQDDGDNNETNKINESFDPDDVQWDKDDSSVRSWDNERSAPGRDTDQTSLFEEDDDDDDDDFDLLNIDDDDDDDDGF